MVPMMLALGLCISTVVSVVGQLTPSIHQFDVYFPVLVTYVN